MKRLLASFSIFLVVAAALHAGCSESNKSYETAPISTAHISTIAPVTTFSLSFLDSLSAAQKQELFNSINLILQAFLQDYGHTINNTFNVVINIVNTEVNITVKGNKYLVWCGNSNECPNLYEAICTQILGENHPDKHKWKNRCKQIEDDCKKLNGH